MLNQFSRTELLLGREGMERLSRARVAVFGVGGVGGYAVEALARSGVGALDLIDDDRVSLSNLNRQIIATQRTIGQYKVDAARQRIGEINPDCRVTVYKTFFTPETAGQFCFSDYDYIIDAIDTVTGKLVLAEQAVRAGVPIISSMGAGNKLDPTALEVADISQTSVCPLARVMRKELKKRGIYHLKVVYSKEPPLTPLEVGESDEAAGQTDSRGGVPSRRQTPGSNAFVPAAAGLIAAGEVIRTLSGFERQAT
ncbi:MAG: tRNA threonylcarbamoyladenosine dehydratase [Clostridiales bacterium]|nr:tRNA threonylcarbamoyladenosine dehydratase [Clostridiales bacterium]